MPADFCLMVDATTNQGSRIRTCSTAPCHTQICEYDCLGGYSTVPAHERVPSGVGTGARISTSVQSVDCAGDACMNPTPRPAPPSPRTRNSHPDPIRAGGFDDLLQGIDLPAGPLYHLTPRVRCYLPDPMRPVSVVARGGDLWTVGPPWPTCVRGGFALACAPATFRFSSGPGGDKAALDRSRSRRVVDSRSKPSDMR